MREKAKQYRWILHRDHCFYPCFLTDIAYETRFYTISGRHWAVILVALGTYTAITLQLLWWLYIPGEMFFFCYSNWNLGDGYNFCLMNKCYLKHWLKWCGKCEIKGPSFIESLFELLYWYEILYRSTVLQDVFHKQILSKLYHGISISMLCDDRTCKTQGTNSDDMQSRPNL